MDTQYSLVWSNDLTTGNNEVDRQHKELIAGINSLLQVVSRSGGAKTKESQQEANDLLLFLENYVVEHFQYEELLMEKYNCSVKELNEKEHQIFIYRFNNIKRYIKNKGYTQSNIIKLESLLCGWLIHHIKTVDTELDVAIDAKLNKGFFKKAWGKLFG